MVKVVKCALRIVGIDPGYAIVGFGVVEYNNQKFKPLDYGAITTMAKTPFEQRLLKISIGMEKLLEHYKPDAFAIEKLFFTSNEKTVIQVAEARGVIILEAAKQGIPIFEYTPLQVKQSVVGYGKAEKKQVMELTRLLLNLKKIPKPDDAADALAVAICHAHSAGSSLSKINKYV